MTHKDFRTFASSFASFVSNLQATLYRTLATVLFWCAQTVSLGATSWFFDRLCSDHWVSWMFTITLELSALYCSWELWRRWTANNRRPIRDGKRTGHALDLWLPGLGTLVSVVTESLIIWTYWFDRSPAFALWTEAVAGNIPLPVTLVFAVLTSIISVLMAAIEAQKVTHEVITEERRANRARFANKTRVRSNPGRTKRKGKQPNAKAKVFALLDEGDLGPSEIARRLGISKSTASKWRKRYLAEVTNEKETVGW